MIDLSIDVLRSTSQIISHKLIFSFLCLTLFIQDMLLSTCMSSTRDWKDGVGVIKSDRLMINPGVELIILLMADTQQLNACVHF